ncbi:MAG: hypothetical protein RBS17_03285 [Coriobacteriia bacterium]|nr:hypothetical protein [Coriobacteriia bacterium]
MEPAHTTPASKNSWDFTLMAITVGFMGSLGAQSFVGTVYSWWAHRTVPAWAQIGQPGFIDVMNAIAAPQVIALIVVMGLCVPKRLLSRGALLGVSLGMLLLGAITGILTRSIITGLAVYLCAAGVIQVLVIVMTLAGGRGLTYLSNSRLAKAGSGLLHLGFIVMALVVVALQHSAFMLPASMLSAVLLTVGSALAFYARPSSRAPIPVDSI